MREIRPPNVARFRFLLSLVLLLGTLGGVGGCGARVYPPLNPREPTAVYLCDYGVHSSLLLPVGKFGTGHYVEYAFGDWAYAVDNKTDPLHAIGALLVSQKSTFGRRFLRQGDEEKDPYPPNNPQTVRKLIVPGEKVREVTRLLDVRWRRYENTKHLNDSSPDYMYWFVYEDERYGALNNCNHLTAACLQMLDCRVGGLWNFSGQIVMPPGPPRTSPPGPSKLR